MPFNQKFVIRKQGAQVGASLENLIASLYE